MPKRIEKIIIENIRGISLRNLEFEEFYENRLNILVAPNGFGKTSFAIAFDSLNQSRLTLQEDEFFNGNASLNPKLIIQVFDGINLNSYQADRDGNEISRNFDISVLKPRLISKTKQGYGNIRATSQIAHEKMTLATSIPENVSFEYRKSEMKKIFSNHKLAVKDIKDLLKENDRLMLWLFHNPNISKMDQARVTNLLGEILNTNNQISNLNSFKQKISALTFIEEIYEYFASHYPLFSEEELIISFYQILKICNQDKVRFLACIRRELYKSWKNRIQETLRTFNSTNLSIVSVTETGGELEFSFENIKQISNGQRDIISFIAQLYRTEYKLLYTSKKQDSIIIIDEIFDYLDDANIVTCQYFLSKFIQSFEHFGKNIFPIILTHLAPKEFDTYRLKKVKHHFLEKRTSDHKNQNLRKMIKARCDRFISDADEEKISKYFLHFHPDLMIDLPAVGLVSLSDNRVFYSINHRELTSYLTNTGNYDPFSICASIRIKIEQYIYTKLDSNQQAQFLRAKGTNNKLEFASNNGVDIPEVFYLLGVIYNEALHAKENQFKYIESKIDYNLKNGTIKNLIKETILIIT